MSDNVAISAGTGTVIATDEVGGVHYQRVKLVIGTPDSSAPIPSDETNGLDVDVTRVQGTVAVGDGGGSLTVDGTVAVSGNVTVVQPTASSLNVTVGAALPAGSNAIGKLAANSGVDIGDVDVASVTPGVAAANLGKAEDAAHASGDTGVMALAVRNDNAGTTFGANGDYTPLAVDANGRVGVADLGGAISVDDNGGSLTVDATLKWEAPEAIATTLSTELNSLADGSYSNASSAIGNATGLYGWMLLELSLASLTPTAGGFVAVYLLPSADGTNYEDGGGSTAPPAGSFIASFDLSTSTGAKRRVRWNIPIPPLAFKLVALNKSGATLAASGNTLKYRRYTGAFA